MAEEASAIEGNVTIELDMETKFTNEYPEGPYAMIGIKLSYKQMESILYWKLDFNKIKSLQQAGQWADTEGAPLWKAGKNFENAILVGYRKRDNGTNDVVYLKMDGWFTTPKDITNCIPVLDENGFPFYENGYLFDDASAEGSRRAALASTKFAKNVTKDAIEKLGPTIEMAKAWANSGAQGGPEIAKALANSGAQGGKTRKHKSKRKSQRKHKRNLKSKRNRKATRRYKK
jgi:hypothetical protein